RHRLCGFLEQLWQEAVAQRYELAPRSAVPLLNEILIAHGQDRTGPAGKPAPQNAPQEGGRPSSSPGKGPLTLVGLRGLEPRTSSLSGKRSNRLSYSPSGGGACGP